MELSLRTFEAMQYFEYYDTNDINIIRERIENLTQIQDYAIIIHDKDKENDKLKPPHFHIVARLKNQMTITQIANTLKLEKQYINKIKSTTRKAYEYLIHKNDSDKYQYDIKDVYSNFDYEKYITTQLKKEKENDIVHSILNDIDSGSIKQYNICDKCDIHIYTKYKTTFDKAFIYRQQKIMRVQRDMKCIFIYGASGVGKTTYAKEMAKTLKIYGSPYISSGGDKLFDDYQGQDVVILDDIRGDVLSISDLLKLLDNNTNSLVGCRYYNKSIYECKLIILTSTIGPLGFFEKCKNSTNEDVKQLLRRLNIVIEMTNEKITYHSFDNNEGLDIQLKSIPNVFKKYYDELNKDKNRNELVDQISNINFNGATT